MHDDGCPRWGLMMTAMSVLISGETLEAFLRERLQDVLSYNTSDLPAGGNAVHRDNGIWHCSTPTAGENERLFLLALAAGLTLLAAVGPLSWPEEFAADAFALNETGQQCARAHLDALNGVLNEVPGPTHPSKRRRVAALG
jgi:Zn-dependent protease with chaperone function